MKVFQHRKWRRSPIFSADKIRRNYETSVENCYARICSVKINVVNYDRIASIIKATGLGAKQGWRFKDTKDTMNRHIFRAWIKYKWHCLKVISKNYLHSWQTLPSTA